MCRSGLPVSVSQGLEVGARFPTAKRVVMDNSARSFHETVHESLLNILHLDNILREVYLSSPPLQRTNHGIFPPYASKKRAAFFTNANFSSNQTLLIFLTSFQLEYQLIEEHNFTAPFANFTYKQKRFIIDKDAQSPFSYSVQGRPGKSTRLSAT